MKKTPDRNVRSFFFASLLLLTGTAASANESLDVGGTDLSYYGRGSGDPVVFFHGNYGSSEDFKWSILPRVALNHRAVAFDLAGHGMSGRPDRVMTLDDHAEFLHEGMMKLGISKPVIVGHSWGGAVALAYALKYPDDVAGLVLLGAYIAPYKGLDLIYRVTTVPVFGDLFAAFVVWPLVRFRNPVSLLEKVFYPDEVPEGYAKIMVPLAVKPAAFTANARDIKSLGPDLEKMEPRYPDIHVPVVILSGDRDATAPPDRHARPLHRAIKGSKLIILSNTGHQPAFTKSDEVVAAIDGVR